MGPMNYFSAKKTWQKAKDAMEKEWFLDMLDAHGGSVDRACVKAGIHRSVFYQRLVKHGIDIRQYREGRVQK